MATRFQEHPRPNTDVIEALEKALKAARLGHIRAITIATVNPLHEPEIKTAGDQTTVYQCILIGALARAAHSILETVSQSGLS